MQLIGHVVVLDAANVAEVSRFWAALLGGSVVDDYDRFHCVIDQHGHWVLGGATRPRPRATGLAHT